MSTETRIENLQAREERANNARKFFLATTLAAIGVGVVAAVAPVEVPGVETVAVTAAVVGIGGMIVAHQVENNASHQITQLELAK